MSGKVAWFTGLSGAGKTTIARRTFEILEERGKRVLSLDGDVVRATANQHLGFSPEDIRENNRLIAGLCRESLPEYDVILVPIISPFKDSRAAARVLLGNDFTEVYVHVSLEEAIRRDPKGLYQKALDGSLPGFIGVAADIPYEPPDTAEITLDTENEDVEVCAQRLVNFLLAEPGRPNRSGWPDS